MAPLFATLICLQPVIIFSVYIFSSIHSKLDGGKAGKGRGFMLKGAHWRLDFTKYLHVSICLTLAANAVIALYVRGAGLDCYWWIDEAYLTSILGQFILFLAGILPDPESPYNPTKANGYTWIFSAALELFFVIEHLCRSSHYVTAACDITQLILTCVRIMALIIMASLLFLPTRDLGDDDDLEPLNDSIANGLTYGAIPSPAKGKDAQSTDWLDYIVGFGKLAPFLWPSKSLRMQLVAILSLLIMQRIVNVLVPHQLGVVVLALETKTFPVKEVMLYILFRALQGQQGVLGSIRALLWIPIGQTTYRKLTASAFEHVLSLSLDFHLGKRLGEVMAALSKGSAINTFLDSLIFQLLPMVLDLWIAAAYFLVKFDHFYSLILITVTWTYLFVTIQMAKYRGKARREMVMRDREMDAAKTDAIMSYETVHYNSATSFERSRFEQRMAAFQKGEFSVLVSLNMLNVAQNLIFAVGVMLASLLSAYQISLDIYQVAMFVTILAYLSQVQAPLNFFGSFYTQIKNNLIDAEWIATPLIKKFKEQPTVVDGPDAQPMNKCSGKISLEHVNFGYDPRRQALYDVSFTVQPGSSVAIVGESGSGKSTLLKLLLRFYEVDSGIIKIDDCSVKNYTIESLRSHFGVVPQDTMLFNDTLMYNLLYARPDATLDEIHSACMAASIHDKICAFPDGYQTKVGERGLRLSGGEKQRIALARTILKNPQIILLDEATASLDTQTETLIQSSLEKVSKGRTSITIAHRLSTITKCDQIIVLHEGRIVEQGKHEELLELGGRYSVMWAKQTKAEHKDQQAGTK